MLVRVVMRLSPNHGPQSSQSTKVGPKQWLGVKKQKLDQNQNQVHKPNHFDRAHKKQDIVYYAISVSGNLARTR